MKSAKYICLHSYRSNYQNKEPSLKILLINLFNKIYYSFIYRITVQLIRPRFSSSSFIIKIIEDKKPEYVHHVIEHSVV